MIIKVVNQANNSVIEQIQTKGMSTDQFMEWLTKWGMDSQVGPLLIKASLQPSEWVYTVSCKLVMTYPI